MTYQDKTNIKKIAYTIFVILACLTLSHIPVWGLSSDTLSQLFKVPILMCLQAAHCLSWLLAALV